MARPRTRTLVAAATPLVVLAVLVAAWAVAGRTGPATVVPNVELDGRDVGGLDRKELAAAVGEAADDFATTPVRIESSKGTYTSTAGDLGVVVDEDATAADVAAVGDDDAVLARPFLWLASFAAPREAQLRYDVRRDALDPGLTALQGDDGAEPVEPAIVASADKVGVRAGVPGSTLDADEVAERLVEDAAKGEDPIRISVSPVERPPAVTTEAAQALADELTASTAAGLTVRIRQTTTQVEPALVRSWLGSTVTDGALAPRIDAAKAMADIRTAVGPLTAEAEDASFDVVAGQVRLNPAREGYSCCADDSGERLLEAIEAGRPEVELALVVEEPGFTTAEAEAFGIREPVGTTTEWKGQPQVRSFTTYHACCESRVTNIHRMADLVRGAVIPPGGTFSINDRVGERTTAKGFVEAGAIANGVHTEEVGGGVSQFSTTLFNAAFFAGLDFETYQSHSIYFDRYPRGREATLGFPAPDNEIRNDTPYGVLIWADYTDTSLTVTLYSTQHVYGEQTAQTEEPAGPCTRVRTTRTRRWADGRTATDTVGSVYRPREGVDC